jgi:hypothetical protein
MGERVCAHNDETDLSFAMYVWRSDNALMPNAAYGHSRVLLLGKGISSSSAVSPVALASDVAW